MFSSYGPQYVRPLLVSIQTSTPIQINKKERVRKVERVGRPYAFKMSERIGGVVVGYCDSLCYSGFSRKNEDKSETPPEGIVPIS